MKATTVLLFAVIMLALCVQTYSETSLVTCQKPSQDKSTCLKCRNFYHLFEGQCFINILGCENYIFGNICKRCAKGFILVNNECCDRACMRRIYNEEHHETQVAENRQEVLRKAEVEGLERCISVISKNSVKTG